MEQQKFLINEIGNFMIDTQNKPDITSHQDIEQLVDSFYAKVRNDKLLSPVFLNVDWQAHLPKMHNFWAFILLGEPGYTSNLVQKHLPLKIQAEHFTRWLELFNQCVDEKFSGDKADEAKSRAYSMGVVIQVKMGLGKNL